MRSVVPALILLCAACAGSATPRPSGSGLSGDAHDRAYLSIRLRDEGCHSGIRSYCCPVLQQRLDEALSRDELATAATALDALAIACPDRRDRALAALEHKSTTVPAPDSGKVAVVYSARIGPSDRLYWVSAFVDGKHLAGKPLAPGPHTLEVDIHVMTAAGTDKDTLFRIQARKELVLEPNASRTFQVALSRNPSPAGDNPFSLELLEKPRPDQPRPIPDAKPSSPSEPPSKITTPGRLTKFPKPRLPSELNRGKPWGTMLSVCVDSGGRVSSLIPLLDPPHPRLLGVLFDSLAHAEYTPYAINGRPAPFCYPLRINVSPS